VLQKDVALEQYITQYLPGESLELAYGLSSRNTSLRNFTLTVYLAVKVDVSDVSLIIAVWLFFINLFYIDRRPLCI